MFFLCMFTVMGCVGSAKKINKARWTQQEDDKLRVLVEKYGMEDFQRISTYFTVSNSPMDQTIFFKVAVTPAQMHLLCVDVPMASGIDSTYQTTYGCSLVGQVSRDHLLGILILLGFYSKNFQ